MTDPDHVEIIRRIKPKSVWKDGGIVVAAVLIACLGLGLFIVGYCFVDCMADHHEIPFARTHTEKP